MTIFSRVAQNIKPFLISFGITNSMGFLYIQSLTSKNRKKWEDQVQDTMTHDNTRDTNEYFGLNWGYAADDMIKTKLDSGDILFLKQDCSLTFSVNEFISCYK